MLVRIHRHIEIISLSLDVAASNHPPCVLASNANPSPELRTIFLRDGWRKRLCRCDECCVSRILSICWISSKDLLIRNYMIIPN